MIDSISCVKRRWSRPIKLRNIQIGGNAPIRVQTMTKTPTTNIELTISEVKKLASIGCEVIRIGIPDKQSAYAIKDIVNNSPIPVIADIHFDHELALICIENGVDGIRINPGNINDTFKVKEIVSLAKKRQIPIRVGVNAGSLNKKLIDKYGKVTPLALVEAALREIELLESENFYEIKVAIKSFDIYTTIEANRILASRCHYPIHVGITEAGLYEDGLIRSAIGIGMLLYEGIGDTIRVSLSSSSEDEIRVGYKILQVLNIRNERPTIISCPTCSRCQIFVVELATKVEEAVKNISKPIKIAIMGCAVNGPGEAKMADYGIAGAKNGAVLFKHGNVIKFINSDYDKIVEELVNEIKCDLENYKDKQ